MAKLRVGIAGFGVVGAKRKACIDANPSMSLVAVCDQKFNKKLKVIEGVTYTQNYQQLLKNNLDVLFVCLPNDLSAKVTIAGLQANLHVFCEKPPGKNIEEIKQIIEIEKQFPNSKLMYGFNHRYHDSIKETLRILESGKMGKIINMRGVYGKAKLITFNQPDWRTKREISGGGVLLDQGIHMLDLMRLFGGEYTQIYSFISNSHWGYDVEDNAYALMKTNDGVIAMLNSSATQWRHRFNLDINLEGGSLILGGLITGTKSYGSETLTVITADPDNDKGDPLESITRYNSDPSWQNEVDIFANCIINNKKITSSNSLDALNTMKLVYQIYYNDAEWRNEYKITNPNQSE